MAERIRIVQLTGSSSGGVRRHAHELSAALSGDHQVLLCGPPEVISAAPVPTAAVAITDRPRPGDIQVIRQLRHIGRQADVVHAHGLRAGALAAIALAGLPAQLVVTLHNKPVGGRKVQMVSQLLARIIARRAGAVLGVSGDLVSWAKSWGVPIVTRALVPAPRRAPEGPDGAAIPGAELGVDPGSAVLLTIARLAPQKGMELLLQAAAIIAAEVPQVHWIIAGDGPLLAELRAAATAVPVTFLGARSDIPDLLATADVVVSTSEWEGQPLNLQEALQAGAAIVTTDVGGSGEVTGDAAVRVPYDAAALAKAVVGLLRDPQERAQRRAAARKRATELPTTADMHDQAAGIYISLLG